MGIEILLILAIILIVGSLIDGLNFKLSKKKEYKYSVVLKAFFAFGFLSLFILIRILI